MPRRGNDFDYGGFAPVLEAFPVIWDSGNTDYKLVDSTRRAYKKIEKRLKMEGKNIVLSSLTQMFNNIESIFLHNSDNCHTM